MKWLRMMFKAHIKVFVPVDEHLHPIEENGLVPFVYQLKSDAASYTTKRSALSYIDGAQPQDMPDDAVELRPATVKKKEKKEKDTPLVTEPLSCLLQMTRFRRAPLLFIPMVAAVPILGRADLAFTWFTAFIRLKCGNITRTPRTISVN